MISHQDLKISDVQRVHIIFYQTFELKMKPLILLLSTGGTIHILNQIIIIIQHWVIKKHLNHILFSKELGCTGTIDLYHLHILHYGYFMVSGIHFSSA